MIYKQFFLFSALTLSVASCTASENSHKERLAQFAESSKTELKQLSESKVGQAALAGAKYTIVSALPGALIYATQAASPLAPIILLGSATTVGGGLSALASTHTVGIEGSEKDKEKSKQNAEKIGLALGTATTCTLGFVALAIYLFPKN